MKFDKKLTSVGTSLLLLQLLSGGDMYGYQIIRELSQRSKNVFELQEGTLYPVLHSLEKNGYISSYTVQAENDRLRKYYKITAAGRRQLQEKKEEWSAFSSAMDQMLGGNA